MDANTNYPGKLIARAVRPELAAEINADAACPRRLPDGCKAFVDASATCAHFGFELCQRARAHRDGVAAADAVRGMGLRYLPPPGASLCI